MPAKAGCVLYTYCDSYKDVFNDVNGTTAYDVYKMK